MSRDCSAGPLLEVSSLQKLFGGLVAVDNVSFHVATGEIVAIIGPNGAGKTTLFNLLSGVYVPDHGEIRFRGVDVCGAKPFRIAQLGLARTFQNLQIFGNMTVVENVMVGRHVRSRYGLVSAAFRLPWARREEEFIFRKAMEYLGLVGLDGRAEEIAANLSFGEQRRLEIARALAAEPALLLLDEPGAGLTREEVDELDNLICRIRDQGGTILLVEHDMELVMGVADRVIVLNHGKKIAEGDPDTVQQDQSVIQAYLGDTWE
jgi:branched-chain amino acid transport system ATP-binding protein